MASASGRVVRSTGSASSIRILGSGMESVGMAVAPLVKRWEQEALAAAAEHETGPAGEGAAACALV
jgi:hypothetical protein